MTLQTACNHELLMNISLEGFSPRFVQPTTLVLDDVLQFAVFNLTRVCIELHCIVGMNDNDLLQD